MHTVSPDILNAIQVSFRAYSESRELTFVPLPVSQRELESTNAGRGLFPLVANLKAAGDLRMNQIAKHMSFLSQADNKNLRFE